MVQQDFFDNLYFPIPEVPKKVFYFVEFSQLRWVEGHIIIERIAGQYLEQNHLDMIEGIALDFFKLFRTPINIQITKKREKFD